MTATAVDSPPRTDGRPVSSTVRRQERGRGRRSVVCFAACLALFALYFASSFANDLRGTMLADSGGKLATLRVMADTGRFDPDVGYWAAGFDPTGALHPLAYTKRVGDSWVQASTLPMLYAALPLYELGGLRAALVLPMLGGVLVALAARALARRFSDRDRAGWTAFWAVGLLTPVVLYAASFWEHTLGLAAMVWAIVLTIDVVREQRTAAKAALVGLLFGFAITMRGEALVYALVTGIVALVVLTRAHATPRRLAALGGAGAAGVAAVTLANQLLEVATVGGSLRASASSGAAVAGRDALGAVADRLTAGATSLTGVNGFDPSVDDLVGLVAVVAVCLAVWSLSARRARPIVRYAAAFVAALFYSSRFVAGFGYVPGLFVASPLAALGVVAVVRDRRLRVLGALALAPIPVIWATQYLDTQRFQWGNRYALTSGTLLAVAAIVALDRAHAARALALAFAVAVTVFGLVFVADRTHSIGNGMAELVARHDAVLIVDDAHLLREGGDFYRPDRQWLSVETPEELRAAARVARAIDAHQVTVAAPTWVELPRHLAGFRRGRVVDTVVVRPDQALSVVEYHAP